MSKLITIQASPEQAADEQWVRQYCAEHTGFPADALHLKWRKRSLDARKPRIVVNGHVEVYPPNSPPETPVYYHPQQVSDKPQVAIVGMGPAGLFAALHALEQGFCPVIFERGQDVRTRRRDLAALNKHHLVNPESNYCFGEGGAGTYSDGKLYTRSKKRGDVQRVLEWLVHFGAPENILADAHPHIGTNKLPGVITAMRTTILQHGGHIHFGAKVTDLLIEDGQVKGLVINQEQTHPFQHVLLATGHSARDVFYLLHQKGLRLEAKPFALGVRVEHSQEMIDQMQYHGQLHGELLPPASYSLVTQVDGQGVFSFCMCPGGIIAPCATSPGEVVTNGWSPSKRNNPYANSGIVVTVSPESLPDYQPDDPFVCLRFQQAVEQKCFEAAGGTQAVPAQCLEDFVKGQPSVNFPRSSYQPGIVSVNLKTVLPTFIYKPLRQAFLNFDKKMPGFLTNDAVVHAPESRTSSPVRIPRNPETLTHPDAGGLYPCGEGAGYAGGIVSAAMDGVKCMDAMLSTIKKSRAEIG
jgi:uncharacterized FAD-dependent dehydrogenase